MQLSNIVNLPRVHILKVTLLPATEKNGLRVKIASTMWKQHVIVACNNTPGSDIPKVETAVNWCEENGFPVIGFENSNTHAFIVTSYNTPLPLK